MGYADEILMARPFGYWRLGDTGGYGGMVLRDGPSAYWRLNERAGTSFADSSGNGHTAALPPLASNYVVAPDSYRALILAEGPSGYWPCDETSGVLEDATGHGNPLTLRPAGLTFGVAGAIGDGRTGFAIDHALASVSPALSLSGPVSFEWWIKPALQGGDTYGVLMVEDDTGNGFYLQDDGSGGVHLNAFFWGDQRNTTALVPGTLYHVVAVVTAAGGGTWYVNGVADGTFSYSGLPLDRMFGDFAGEALVASLIDEIAIYPVALTPTRIAAHYARPANYPAVIIGDNPLAYWRCDETAGAVLHDNTGHGYDMALGLTYGLPGAVGGSRTALRVTNAQATLATTLDFSTGPVTFECWVKPALQGNDTYGSLFGCTDLNAGRGFYLQDDGSGGVHLNAYFVGDQRNTTALVPGTLYHIAAVVNASGAGTFYVNGVADGTFTYTGLLLDALFDNEGQEPAKVDLIDEIAVHRAALTAAQLTVHYAQRITAPLVPGDSSCWCQGGTGLFSTVGHTIAFGDTGVTAQVGTVSGTPPLLHLDFAPPIPVGTAPIPIGTPVTEHHGIVYNVPGVVPNDPGIGTTTPFMNCDNPVVLSGAGTIEVWVKSHAIPNAKGYSALLVTATDGFGLWLEDSSIHTPGTDRILASWYDPDVGAGGAWATTLLNPDTLYHIVITRDGLGGGKWYINGVFDSLVAGPGLVSTMALPLLACADYSRGSVLEADLFDEVAVYPYELSASQIAAHYTLRVPIEDSSGLAHHGAAHYGVALGEPGIVPGNAAAGFDGVAGYISVEGDIFGISATSPFTFESWIRPTTLGAYGEAVSTAGAQATLGKTNGNKFWFGRNGSGGIVLAGATTFTPSIFHHVVGTFDGSQLRLYVNGVLDAGPLPWAGFVSSHGVINIGRDASYGEYFTGTLDEVVVYGYALSPAQVALHYALRAAATLVYIDGVERQALVNWNSLNIDQQLGSRKVAHFVLEDPDGVYAPAVGNAVLIYNRGEREFFGSIEETTQTGYQGLEGSVRLTTTVACTSREAVLDRHLVAAVYENQSLGAIVRDIVADCLVDEDIRTDAVEDGPLIVLATFPYISVNEAFNDLKNLTGYSFWIDDYSVLHFRSRDSILSPFNLSDTPAAVSYVIVGGGGGGGRGAPGATARGGGGGGGGGLLTGTDPIVPGSYSVVIGLGGLGALDAARPVGNAGSPSSFHGRVAPGGGRGGAGETGLPSSGGPGGGAGDNNGVATPGAPSASSAGDPEWFAGGANSGSGATGGSGGGGGGVRGQGANGVIGGTLPTLGGQGMPVVIAGVLDIVGAGGKGGAWGGGASGANGTPYRGNGGDGSAGQATVGTTTGAGSSGLVTITYPEGDMVATGGTVTHGNGYVTHTFITSGAFIVSSVRGTAWVRDFSIRQTRQDYRNRQFMRAGVDTTSVRSELFRGDNTRQTFNLEYPVGLVPSVVVTGLSTYPSEVILDVPEGYWRLNEGGGATAADSGPSGHTGTISGGVTLGVATGPGGVEGSTCMAFNGTTGKIVTNAINLLPLANVSGFTVEGWIKTASAAEQAIWSNRLSGTGVLFGLTSGYVFLENGPSGVAVPPTRVVGDMLVNDNAWHFVAAINDGVSTAFFVDGAVRSAVAQPYPLAVSHASALGWDATSGLFFNGGLDEIVVYRHAVSSDRLRLHYSRRSTLQTVGIRGVETNKSWYWNKDVNEISQDAVFAPLTTAQTITVTYQGLFPILIEAQNDAEIAARQAVEGYSGVYEAIEQDASVESGELAMKEAEGYLAQYGYIKDMVSYWTEQPGLHVGQIQTIRSEKFRITGDAGYLLTGVSLQGIAEWPGTRYSVSAISGYGAGGWVEFFQNLFAATRQFMIRENEVLLTLRRQTETVIATDATGYALTATHARVGFAKVGLSEVV